MSQNFQPGDYLIFQVESGYGLLQILEIENFNGEAVWHLRAFNEMFPDIESADAALENDAKLTVSYPHIALTNRAFESTQVARMKNAELQEKDLEEFDKWKSDDNSEVSDRSVRLMLGIR